MPNLYLIGMMGSGKSVTGKRLAALLGTEFVDLDDRIKEKARLTIPEIFEQKGEAFFRGEETRILRETAAGDTLVVATGGGIILRPENVAWMHGQGKIIYLETSLEELWTRLKAKKDRPLLKGDDPRKNLERLLNERAELYEKACDFKVDTDGCPADRAARKILKILEGRS